MFQKLVKYDLKSAGKWYLSLYVASLLVATALGLGTRLLLSLKFTPMTALENGFFALLFMAMVVLLIGLSLATIFLIVSRFYDNLFGPEGYLTLTLPVTSHQLILSKLTAALIWLTATGVTLALSFFLYLLSSLDLPEIIHLWPELWATLFSGLSFPLALVALLVTGLSQVLLIYLCLSLGQLWPNRKGLTGVALYLGLSALLIFTQGILLPQGQVNHPMSQAYLITSLFLAISKGLISYWGTHLVLSRKLNLH